MGGIMGGGAKAAPVDTSYLDEQRAQAEENKAKAERENEARLRVRRGRGGRSLLQFGTDQGVLAETLG